MEVALPVPVDSLFSYGVPAALAPSAEPGRRALVPFGARSMTGLIVARHDPTPAVPALRGVVRLVDAEPVVSPALIRILIDAAADAFCPVGLALACATPSGSAPRASAAFAATARGREALARGAVATPLRALLEWLDTSPRSRASIERRFPGSRAGLAALERDGLVSSERIEAVGARAPTERLASLAPGTALDAALEGPLSRAPRQAALLQELAARGPTVASELGADAAPALRALVARGLVRVEERPLAPSAPAPLDDGDAEPLALTPEQQEALDSIGGAVRARRFERFLLHGVTGSGKTEVYLRAVAEALAAGRQALVLVPEITLTHQLLARLTARFGARVAVLHSQLRPGERIAEWRRLLGGSTPIGIGARSALFAPLDDLGVVVIDEEHEPAYKNEEGFRYHARDLASRRAAAAGCPLVLGSATPSLESRFAADRGALVRLSLPYRIGRRPLPAVEIVDLAAERAFVPRGRKLVLSRALRRALVETLADGGQAILFLNRRGFSTRVLCFECGHAERCPHCDISLVYHATEQRLRCHYCDHGIDPPDRCSACGAPDTALLGLGTERLEEEVRRGFPEARIARLDRDTARRRGETERVLAALATGQVQILIGTQMVAKGHHFPGVRLVGVIAADQALQLPDFRASERTFQLLTQVAGRAGRGAAPGRVIVQTFAPHHEAIAPVQQHDYEAFYRAEIAHRAALGYPPVGRLVHALVSGPDADATAARAEQLAQRARESGGEAAVRPSASAAPFEFAAGFEVLGPAPAPIARLRDRFRFQVLVKGTDEKRVIAAGRAMARAGARREAHGIRVSVDPDPLNML